MNISDLLTCNETRSKCHLTAINDPLFEVYDYSVKIILIPLCSVVGILGGIVSIFIFTRKSLRISLNIYLTALAMSDIILCSSALIVFTLEKARRFNGFAQSVFIATVQVAFPLMLMAQTISIYMTVGAGFDCFISTCVSKFKPKICRNHKALKIIAAVVVFGIMFNVSHIFEIFIIPCYHSDNGVRELFAELCATKFRFDPLYQEIYFEYLANFINTIIPLILLIVMNSCIIFRTIMTKRTSNSYAETNRSGLAEAVADSTNSADETTTLVVVVILFILSNGLTLIINYLELYALKQIADFYNYLVDISNLLVVLNSAANFFIYLAFNSAYRGLIYKYFSRWFLGRRETKVVNHGRSREQGQCNNGKRVKTKGSEDEFKLLGEYRPKRKSREFTAIPSQMLFETSC